MPALERDNLTVLTDTNVNKINIVDGKATGVHCINAEGNEFFIEASKEVLLSSGAFGSPQILLRSGIGPADEILKHGIEHKLELPGVGKNLQDHIDYVTVHKYKSIKLFGFSIGTLFFKYPYELFKYILTKTGMFTSTVAEAGGFIRSRNDIDIPDTQLHFSPGMIVDHGREHMWGTGISCHTCLLRPKSRGEVTLNSADPLDNPKIDPKFLSHPDDVKDMIAGYKKMMKIMNKEPVSKYTSKHVLRPIDLDDDEDIEKAIRETADTVYHPVGTCKMGSDEMAVVDNRLKVHNLKGLKSCRCIYYANFNRWKYECSNNYDWRKSIRYDYSGLAIVDKKFSLLRFNIFKFLIAEVIIDVRTPEEFQSARLNKAINIEWQNILSIQNNYNKTEKIYLYCRSGNRSQKATEILIDAGFVDVENLGSLEQASETLNLKIIK